MQAIFEALAFDPWTFLLQAINVLVVLGLLYLILWKPLNRTLQNREEKIEGDLREAASIKEQAGEMMASYQQQLDQARQEAQNILQRANAMAETPLRNDRPGQGRAARILEKPGWSWKRRRRRPSRLIQNQAAELVVTVAGKVMARTLTPKIRSTCSRKP